MLFSDDIRIGQSFPFSSLAVGLESLTQPGLGNTGFQNPWVKYKAKIWSRRSRALKHLLMVVAGNGKISERFSSSRRSVMMVDNVNARVDEGIFVLQLMGVLMVSTDSITLSR